MADTDDLRQDDIEQLLEATAEGTAPTAAADPASAPAPSPPAEQPLDADVQALLNQAEQALASVEQPHDPAATDLQPFQLRDFASAPAPRDKASLQLVRDVELNLKIELGRTHMQLEDVLQLRKGSVVQLDRPAGDPVDIVVNGRLIARGEVLVLNDTFCIRVGELVSSNETD